jgi:molybdate transport system substrate-binding protein
MSRLPLVHLVLFILGTTALSGCEVGQRGAHQAAGDHSADPRPLRIAAASDLQRVLPRLVERFQARTQATTTLTFDSSGRLAEQIRAGAPFDVFLSANTRFVTDLASEGLIVSETVRPYARGSLVLCVHKSVREDVSDLSALKQARVRKIAIANPEYAPYGIAARQALERAGFWSSLEPKIVRAESVRQAMVYVQNGDAEAALVSRALADVPEVRVVEIDRSLYEPLIQAAGVVAATTQRDRAAEFLDFTVGEEGQGILRAAGFENAPAEAKETDRGAAAKPGTPSR